MLAVRRLSVTSLSHRDGREGLQVDRARHVPGDVRLEGERRARVRVGDAGQDRHDLPVRLLVELGPLRLVGLLLRLVEDVLHRLHLVVLVRAPLLLRALEEDADEVVRIAEVTGPPEEVDLELALVGLAEVVRAPRRAVRSDLEAGLLEARCEGLEVPLRIGHVRP